MLAVVTVGTRSDRVGVRVAKFVGSGQGDQGTLDAGLTVLLPNVTVDAGGVGIAAHVHRDGVRRGAFAFVVNGGHMVGVAVHVVGQRTVSIGGVADVVHLGGADELTVAVHVIGTEGTVDDSRPVQHDLLVLEDVLVDGGQVVRAVEVGGEAPNRAAHALRATVVAHLYPPEVVGVVPKVGHGVAVGQLARPFGHDGLRMTGFRIVGRSEHQAPLGGVGGQRPLQRDAGGLEAVGIVGRRRVESKTFNRRARHGLGIDGHLEVRRGRRGHQIIGASFDGSVGDDGAVADAFGSGGLGASVVVGSHGAALAFKAFLVEGHFAVLAIADAGVQHTVLREHELVDGIITFLDFGERQGVVVVQSGIVGCCRHFHEGERGGLGASHLPHIRNGGVVDLDHDGPDVGGAIAFGDGHKLTLNHASLCGIGADGKVNTV